MSAKNIVIGQKVDPQKTARARELRHMMTPAEQLLWQHLRANRLGGWHFRRQQVIAGFIVDFYCHAAGLVVEVDGGVHIHQAGDDEARDRALRQLGIKTLRVRNEEVINQLEEVLARITAELT